MPPPDPSRPRLRRGVLTPAFILLFPAALLFLAFFANPLTDLIVSQAASAALGFPVEIQAARYEFPSGASFREARLLLPGTAGDTEIRSGRLDYYAGEDRFLFRASEIDLRQTWRTGDSGLSRFVQTHGLGSGLVLKDSRWSVTRSDGALFLRLLGASAGEAFIKGGARLDKRQISRWNAALWLPKALWDRFPELIEKRFTSDASGRRLFKMTWSAGRLRLWGRSAPVLEASWR